MSSCQVEACLCSEALPMKGSVDTCVGCKHPIAVHIDTDNISVNPTKYCTPRSSTSSSSAITIPTIYPIPPRSESIVEEVKQHRQRVNLSQDQTKSTLRPKFNTLSTIATPFAKPVNKSASLFFFRKGSSRPTAHGLPTLIQLSKHDRIPDWQLFLQQQVQNHPAWKSYPNIKLFEIDPHKPICVGYWEGGNTIPNANELTGAGIIADLLRLVENPKSTSTTSTITSRSGQKTTESIKMAYTVHIRTIGDSSDEETDTNPTEESSSSCSHLDISLPATSKNPPRSTPTHQNRSSNLRKSPRPRQSVIRLVDKLHTTSSSSHTNFNSATPSVIHSNDDNTTETRPDNIILHRDRSSFQQSIPSEDISSRPSTPKNSNSLLGRKRSLTLLSPQKISTRTTQDLKKSRSTGQLVRETSSESGNDVILVHQTTGEDSDSTELDSIEV